MINLSKLYGIDPQERVEAPSPPSDNTLSDKASRVNDVSQIALDTSFTDIPLINDHMTRSPLPKQTQQLPSKARYFAIYAGITLSAVLVISALALIILHRGLPPTHDLLKDEVSLLPSIGALLGVTAVVSGIGTWMHYKHRKDKFMTMPMSIDDLAARLEFESSAL